MSQKQVFTCGECGVQKKETNHWVLGTDGIVNGKPWIVMNPWDDECAGKINAKHFCGTPHAQVWVGKRINEWQQKGE